VRIDRGRPGYLDALEGAAGPAPQFLALAGTSVLAFLIGFAIFALV
jgi:hypothetical protein